jgi:hypothetical protein
LSIPELLRKNIFIKEDFPKKHRFSQPDSHNPTKVMIKPKNGGTYEKKLSIPQKALF